MALPPRLKAMLEADLTEAQTRLAEYKDTDVLEHKSGNGPFVSILEERIEHLRSTIQTLETVLTRSGG